MPRPSHRRSFNRRPKKRLKWFGDSQLKTVETAASTDVNEIIQLVPALNSIESINDFTIEACYIHLNIRRTSPTALAAMSYLVQLLETDSSGTPLEVDSPLSGDPFDWAQKNILKTGCLPIPGVISNGSTGAIEISREVMAEHIEVKTKRRIARASQVLGLTIVSDVSNIIIIQVSWRVLLSF